MMDRFPLKSSLFLLVTLSFWLCAIICNGKQCNPAIEYSACNKKTGKVLACPKCRVCKPGFEPIIPCGAVIGINDTIGICQPCKDGYYSATKDVHSCQICRGSKCFVHEKVAGTCKKDQYDTSSCTGSCEDGYVMNNDKTRCEKHRCVSLIYTLAEAIWGSLKAKKYCEKDLFAKNNPRIMFFSI